MQRLSIYVTASILIVLTVVSGLLQGTMSNRWGTAADLIKAGEALSSVPKQFGSWEMVDEGPLDETAVKTLQSTGSFVRVYSNRITGQSVRVAMIVGPPGPTSVHTPEVCFASRDYHKESTRKAVRVEATDRTTYGEFWSLTFHPKNLGDAPLRVVYAWCQGERWMASEAPRVSFGGVGKLLYKIQLAGAVPDTDSGNTTDPCEAFLSEFIASDKQLGIVHTEL